MRREKFSIGDVQLLHKLKNCEVPGGFGVLGVLEVPGVTSSFWTSKYAAFERFATLDFDTPPSSLFWGV